MVTDFGAMAVPSSAPEWARDWETRAVEQQAARSFKLSTRARVILVTLMLPLTALGHLHGEGGWTARTPVLVPYALIAIVLAGTRERGLGPKAGPYTFLIDVVMIFLLQLRSLDTATFPPAVANFALALYVLVLILTGAAMNPRATWVVLALAAPLQVALMRVAGLGLASQITAVAVLSTAAFSQNRVSSRLIAFVKSAASREVAHFLEADRAKTLTDKNVVISRLLEDARAQSERLEALQQEKELLTSLLVHDLRAPLSAVKSNLQYVRDELAENDDHHLDDDVGGAVNDCLSVTERLNAMISDMLNVTRLESGTFVLTPESIEARPFLQRLSRQLAADARSRQVTVDVVADEFLFDADPALLTRTLENLASNAFRYTPPGGHVQLEARRDGEQVLIAVRNDGPPIPTAARASLFDKFVQAGDANANRRAGWGLGLYFCRLCIDGHRGRITVEDHERWPVSFVIRLPMTVARREAA